MGRQLIASVLYIINEVELSIYRFLSLGAKNSKKQPAQYNKIKIKNPRGWGVGVGFDVLPFTFVIVIIKGLVAIKNLNLTFQRSL